MTHQQDLRVWMRCEAQPRSEVRRTNLYVERAPEVATKQIAKRVSPDQNTLTIAGLILTLSLLIAGCTTVSTQKDVVSKTDVSLKSLCEANRINWNWDGVTQVITLQMNGIQAKGLVGSEVILLGQEKIVLSRPIRFERSTIFVPSDFKEKVIDLVRREDKLIDQVPIFSHKKVREILIDAGHGGKDPGALSRNGAKEKSIALDIATRVKTTLEQHGFKVKMTRQSDVFLTLQERTKIASNGKTDLFVSIHANANPSRTIQGLEVYYAPDLSEEDKREDPRQENLKLMVRNLDMKKSDATLEKIVADMLYTQKQNKSFALARQLSMGVSSYAKVKNRGVKEARFFVLRNTLIPAILIETGYLTNSKEEKLLTTKTYRQKLAHGIAHSILNYTGF